MVNDARADLLLKEIRAVANQLQVDIGFYENLDEAKKRYYFLRQQPGESNASFLRAFTHATNIIEYYGSWSIRMTNKIYLVAVYFIAQTFNKTVQNLILKYKLP